MSDNFGVYSRYYDLLYQDKDYDREADYIHQLVARFAPRVQSVLELGCGTGRHAILLANRGWDVTGVDRSSEMVAAAQEKADDREQTNVGVVQFLSSDARSVRLDSCFDCVLSLFHVVSYQTTNADVTAIFETAVIHLSDDGLFVFDVWYGPAVLSDPPSIRVKRMEDDRTSVLRIAEPATDVRGNVVDVGYTVFVTDKTTGEVETIQEHHPMRYFFGPELDLIASSVGLKIIHSEEWLSGTEPSTKTWGVTFVARKSATAIASASSTRAY